MNISIIIPTLNEAKTLGRLLIFLKNYPEVEIIAADGGSIDETLSIAKYYGITVIKSHKGRGRQLNRGARAAANDTLLFLHSDTLPPPDFPDQIINCLSVPDTSGGAFRLKIEAPGIGYRIIEKGANIRAAAFQMPYGDQAIFVRKDLFLKAGGFPHQTILEDVAFIRQLKQYGKIRLASSAVKTSARRWQRLGLFRTTLLNQVILTGYFFKVYPERLARLYYKNRKAKQQKK